MSVARRAVLGMFLVVCAAAPARAQFTVNTTVDAPDVNPGDLLCADAAGACTLRAAIQESNAHLGSDTIVVPVGLYQVGGALEIADTFGTVTIHGGGATGTIVSGAGTDRVLAIAAGVHATIDNLTINNGHAAGIEEGGGILNAGSLTLVDCVIRDNLAYRGGGLAHVAGLDTLTILNSTIDHNFAVDRGGGIYIQADRRAVVTIAGSTISANTVDPAGGPQGGGIHNANSDLHITNSTISGNSARTTLGVGPGNGGGIYDARSLSLNNVTVTDNTADIGGGVSALIADIANSVVAANHASRAPDCWFTETGRSLGYNLIGNTTECTLRTHGSDRLGSAATPIDPKLLPLGFHGGSTMTHLPGPNSPVVDAGTPDAPGSTPPSPLTPGHLPCAAADQNGVARAQDGDGDGTAVCDIGAVEADTAPPSVPSVVVGVRAEATVEVGDPFPVTVGPIVNTDGDPGSAAAKAETFLWTGAVEGFAHAELPPRVGPAFTPEYGTLHSRSVAGCCVLVPGSGVDFRRSRSQARLTRKFAMGALTPSAPPTMATKIRVKIDGDLKVSTFQQYLVCGSNGCGDEPILHGAMWASVTIDVKTSDGQKYTETATLDLADALAGSFSPTSGWAPNWSFVHGFPGASARLDTLLGLDGPVMPVCPTTAGCPDYAIEMTITTEAYSAYAGGAAALFDHTASFGLIPSPTDPHHADVAIVEVDDDGNPVPLTTPSLDDPDLDRVVAGDTCPAVFNPRQEDTDRDGIGDACDNSPTLANPDQADADGDGVGDAGDTCRFVPDEEQLDSDSDGVGNACDICPLVPNPDQADSDGDGIGDPCDPDPTDGPLGDRDGDGIANRVDNCPAAVNPDQKDSDRDGLGDVCDPSPVPADTVAPELVVAFDPATLDLSFGGVDDMSTVTIVVRPVKTRWDGLREYLLTDAAGNSLKVLVRLQRRDGPIERRAAFSLLSVQYGASAVRLLPFNVTELGWTVDRRGALKQLRQDVTILSGTARRSVQAVYEARRGSTVVRDGRRLFERDGVVPLSLTTSRATLNVDYERK